MRNLVLHGAEPPEIDGKQQEIRAIRVEGSRKKYEKALEGKIAHQRLRLPKK